MPLKITRRENSQAWWIAGTVAGRRVRESTGTDNRTLAEERRAVREAEVYRSVLYGEPEQARRWFFHEAVTSWAQDKPRSPPELARVHKLLRHFGPDAGCEAITLHALEEAARAILRPGHGPATRLREIITPARAVLRHAADRGGCEQPRLTIKVRSKSRTDWITPAQAIRLERAMSDHLRPLLVFLLATGARFSEAARLVWPDVYLADGRVLLRETKNGRDRWVQLCPRALAALGGLPGRDGRVFRDANGAPYRDNRAKAGGGQVRSAWNNAARDAALPGKWVTLKRYDRPSRARRFEATHTPHAMRHSWATWHYAMHKDLLRLKQDGDWSNVALVERYAHLAPDAIGAAAELWRSGPTEFSGTKLTQTPEELKKTA